MVINLMQGDCLELMKEIESGSVDAIICDPPYGTTACKWDSIIPLEPMWEQLKRIIKPNGAIVMTASQPFTTTLIASNMKMFKYEWIWQKSHGAFATAKIQPLKRHENVCVFGEGALTYNRQMTQSEDNRDRRTEGFRADASNNFVSDTTKINSLNYADDYDPKKTNPKSVLTISSERGLHPTQKPVALMEYLIKTYTNEGETVLDFTMGSGTTGVAAKNLNRNFIGIELDEGYFNIAKERIENVR
ncbi:DNA methylase [Vibrio phage 1.086.O._10N.222.51.F8]|nr:DNA methylase [Vibrio phage 1.086.O._10N.222.51.F8]